MVCHYGNDRYEGSAQYKADPWSEQLICVTAVWRVLEEPVTRLVLYFMEKTTVISAHSNRIFNIHSFRVLHQLKTNGTD